MIRHAPKRSLYTSTEYRTTIMAFAAVCLIVIDASAQQPLKTVASESSITAFAWSPDGKWIATGHHGFERIAVRVWDVETMTPALELTGHRHTVYSMAFSPDSKLLVSVASSGEAIRWEIPSGHFSVYEAIHTGAKRFCCFSQNGRIVAIAGSDGAFGTVHIWGARHGFIGKLKGHRLSTNSISFAPDYKSVATGGDDGAVILWTLPKCEPYKTLDVGDAVLSVAYSPDGKRLASGTFDQQLVVWDVSSGSVVWKHKEDERAVAHIAYTPNGRLISASVSAGLKFFRADTGKPVGVMPRVGRYAMSPDGSKLATTYRQGLAIWTIPEFQNSTKE